MIITVVLEALTGSFNTDIDRSAKQAERALKRMEAESRKSLAQFGKILAGAATAAAAGFAVMVKSAINNADELGKLSQKVGVTVEDLSKLAYAAQLSDVELDGLQQGLIKLGDAAVQAQTGTGDAAKAFQALGVSVRDAEGNLKSNYDLLLEVSDAFAGYADGAAKSAVAIDIFGKSGANLIPLLNGGSAAIRQAGDELERFGGVVSQDAAAAADEFNDNLDKITKGGTSLAAQVAADLLPDLKDLSEQFLALAGDGKGVSDTASDIAESFRVLSRVVIVVSNAFQIVGKSIGAIVAEAVALAHGDFAGFLSILKENAADVDVDLKDIQNAIEGVGIAAKETHGDLVNLNSFLVKGQLQYDPEAARKAEAAGKKAASDARRIQESFEQAAAEIFQAQQDRERAALEASLDARLISHKHYLDEKLRLTEAEIDQEIEASKSLLQNAAQDEAILLQARIESLEIRRQIARDEHAAEEATHVRELAAAYDDAARAAKSYVDEISREGQRTLEAFDQTPAQRRFSQGQFQIEDEFRSQREQLDQQFDSGKFEQAEYDKRLALLEGYHEKALAEHARYFDLIEEKRKDFSTSFNNSIQEYVDSTANIGETLGETFVSAIDEAIASTSRLAAEFILFGEGGKDAIYQIARQLSTTLLSALIQVGIQLLINKTLLAAVGGGASSGGTPFGFSDGSFASGGYTGDDPRNKIAGVVHGQEFVVNPEATRKNRDVLEAINAGTFSADSTSVPRSSSQGLKPTTNVRIINVPDKTYIKDYLMGDEGDEVFTNWVGRNSARIKSVVAT